MCDNLPFYCRQSGIPCVMIDGIGKNIKYNIGSNHKMETRWTAVHVDEEWRLIHVGWSLTLRKQGKMTVMISSTVLPAKSDIDFMFCLQSYQGVIIDISLVY